MNSTTRKQSNITPRAATEMGASAEPIRADNARSSTATAPPLTGFDHIHLYVRNREAAARWYADVLGFEPVEALLSWAVKDGPLTLEDPGRTIHLALFDKPAHRGSTAIAFGADGEAFLAWKDHREGKGLPLRITDHRLAYSLYFADPDNNSHEITTYERDFVARRLNGDA